MSWKTETEPSSPPQITVKIPQVLLSQLDGALDRLRKEYPHMLGINRSHVVREGISNWLKNHSPSDNGDAKP